MLLLFSDTDSSIACVNSFDFLLINDEKLENSLPACCVVLSNMGDVGTEASDWLFFREDDDTLSK